MALYGPYGPFRALAFTRGGDQRGGALVRISSYQSLFSVTFSMFDGLGRVPSSLYVRYVELFFVFRIRFSWGASSFLWRTLGFLGGVVDFVMFPVPSRVSSARVAPSYYLASQGAM